MTTYTTRDAILGDIRRHLEASRREPGATTVAPPTMSTARTEPATAHSADRPALIDAFKDAVLAVAGTCVVVPDIAAATRAVAAILDLHRPRRVAASDAPLVRDLLGRIGTDAEVLTNASKPDLFACDVGITSAQWAVAETGTLVLDSDAERHRLASLLPPVHIALVPVDRLRPSIGSVLGEIATRYDDARASAPSRPPDMNNADEAALANAECRTPKAVDEAAPPSAERRPPKAHVSHCITFITGPSRTSDIELTLAIGVHGPGELHVIVIENVSTCLNA